MMAYCSAAGKCPLKSCSCERGSLVFSRGELSVVVYSGIESVRMCPDDGRARFAPGLFIVFFAKGRGKKKWI